MIISRTKAKSRLAKDLPKGSSIRYIKQMAGGDLLAFCDGKKALLTTNDNELPAIIGECCSEDLASIPPSMKVWLEEAEREVKYYQCMEKGMWKVKPAVRGEADASPTVASLERVTVEPLIKALWGQGSPYNSNLTFNGKKSLVGCNAVSMSMIMHYWHERGYNRGCMATSGYRSKTKGYNVPSLPAVTVFDYGIMPCSKPCTEAEKVAVAELCQHIGFALKSDYTPEGTLAYMGDCVRVLKTFLRMGSPKRIYASNGYEVFERQIYEELSAGRPVMMAGYTVNGAGHCFVCDGYDAQRDMYHINWGWSGQCNGYFRLSALDATSARAYNSNKVAIIGIAPGYKLGDVNDDGVVDVSDASAVVDAAMEGKFSERCDVNSDGKVTVSDAELVAGKALGKACL